MLKTSEMKALNTKLTVPMSVANILNGRTVLSDEAQYELHKTISDMYPDTALLSIASSAYEVIETSIQDIARLQVLKMECERIIAEYGVIWLQSARHGRVNEEQVFETLIHTSDDLSSMAALLSAAYSVFERQNSLAAQMCDILHAQATSHALIADAYMDLASELAEERVACTSIASASGVDNNVIQFPRRV